MTPTILYVIVVGSGQAGLSMGLALKEQPKTFITAEEVLLHKERLEKEGFFARDEMDTTCFYAVQDKFWVTDPDRKKWEFFYTKAVQKFTLIQHLHRLPHQALAAMTSEKQAYYFIKGRKSVIRVMLRPFLFSIKVKKHLLEEAIL